MSEQEENAAIGRMIQDHAANKRTLAAMTAERERYQKAFAALAGSLGNNQGSDVNLKSVESDLRIFSVLENIDLKPLVTFLKEYTEIRQAVDSGAARIRDLGV